MKVIETMRDETRASVTTMGSARIYAPLSPGSSASGRNATMLMIVPKRIACRSRYGAKPCRDSSRLAVGHLPINSVGSEDWIVHQHAQGNDERGDGNLMQRYSQERHAAAEGHRDREWNGSRHDQGGAPI